MIVHNPTDKDSLIDQQSQLPLECKVWAMLTCVFVRPSKKNTMKTGKGGGVPPKKRHREVKQEEKQRGKQVLPLVVTLQ